MATKSVCLMIVLSSLLLVLAATGQNPKTAHAVIPFEFWVEGNRLSAGDYIIVHVESMSYWLFRCTDGKSVATVYGLPLDREPATEGDAKLIFRVENGRHYLYGAWGPSGRGVVTTESAWAAPSGAARVEVPITFTEAGRQ